MKQQRFTTMDGAIDYFKALGFADIGMVYGTRTLQKGSVSFVAIWSNPDKAAEILAERY